MSHKNDKFIIVNDEKVLIYSGYYGCYTADYCRSTGKPMLNKSNYKEFADKWLSPSKCKKINKPVTEDEEPIAFYRVMHGYCPLYERLSEEKVIVDKFISEHDEALKKLSK